MKSFKNLSKPLCLALMAAPLMLAACADNGPWAMPSGYTYEHNEYQAPAGPKPVFKKWEFSHGIRQEPAVPATGPQPMTTQLDDSTAPVVATPAPALTVSDSPAADAAGTDSWDHAAKDLVSRLISDFGHPTEAVWLQGEPNASEADVNFDKALRAALMEHQIHIAAIPGGGPYALHYMVTDVGQGRSMLDISLMSGTTKAAEENGLYTIQTSSAPVMVAPAMTEPSANGAPQAMTPQAATAPAPDQQGVAYQGREDGTTAATVQKHTGMADDVEPGIMHGEPSTDRHLNN